MSVERLPIDELKRIEKQASNVLKRWRKLQKDFADLQNQHAKLQEEFRLTVDKNAEVLAAQGDSHREALNVLEQQSNTRYERDVAALNQQLQELQQKHDITFQQQQAENQLRFDALHQELRQERNVKDALIARVRGVDHE